MTQTPLSRSKGQMSRSPGRFTHRGVNASGSCSGERGKVYNLLLRCRLQAPLSARRREALRRPQREERGGGISWRSAAYSLLDVRTFTFINSFTTRWCSSGCVVECRTCNREPAGSNLSLGYVTPRSTQPSIPPGSENEYQLRLGRQRHVWLILVADERVGVQVKL